MGLVHFELDLVLEVFRMVEGSFVENKNVGKCREHVINYDAKEPGDQIQAEKLSSPIVPSQLTHIGSLCRRERDELTRGFVFPIRRGVCGGHLAQTGGGIRVEARGPSGQKCRINNIEQIPVEGFEYDIHGSKGCSLADG